MSRSLRATPVRIASLIACAMLSACASAPPRAPAPEPRPHTDLATPLDELPTLARFADEPAPPPDPAPPPAPAAEPEHPAPPPALGSPFTAKERLALFPRGDLRRAREENRRGLALREAGDQAGALVAYESALAASPRFAPARYNRACELALLPDPTSRTTALDELETLLRLDTPDARLFVARARFDPDFDPVRAEARFTAIIESVTFDPALPLAEQYCADPGRLGALIDPVRGVEIVVETESADESIAPIRLTEHATGRAAFDRVMWIMNDMAWSICQDEPWIEGSITKYRLARAQEPVKCLALPGEGEWSVQYLACFVKEDGRWWLASLSMWPDGPLDETSAYLLRLQALGARERGLRRFGLTP